MFFQPNIGQFNAPSVDLSKLDVRGAVLVRSTNWLGDAVMTVPGVYRIFQQFPDSRRVILCQRKLESFWNTFPWVDTVISFDNKRVDKEMLAAVRALKPELTVILPNSFGSAFDLWKERIPNRFGRAGRFRTSMLDYTIPEYARVAGNDQWHQVRHYLEFSAALGNPDWGCDFPPPSANVPKARSTELYPFGADDRTLVIAPGAAYGPAKQWSAERFHVVASWWSKSVGPVICTGTATEVDACEFVTRGLPNAISLAGNSSLTELIYVLERARCALVNDSGTMHLAAALQKDGVAIFGSTDPIATGPAGGRWIIKEVDLPCRPCLKRTCPLPENAYGCLTGTTPESVIESLKVLLT